MLTDCRALHVDTVFGGNGRLSTMEYQSAGDRNARNIFRIFGISGILGPIARVGPVVKDRLVAKVGAITKVGPVTKVARSRSGQISQGKN